MSTEGPTHAKAGTMFSSIAEGKDTITVAAFLDILMASGLNTDSDPRLENVKALTKKGFSYELNEAEFTELVEGNNTIARALMGLLVIPDWKSFCADIDSVYEKVLPDESGANADYIPQLARVDPNQFGVAVTTIDGQQYTIGESDVEFCVQSCSKPISYCIAMTQNGSDEVEKHIGTEPSGHGFNEMVLDPKGLPHNPMINAGAIMAVSLLFRGQNSGDRFSGITEYWERLFGGKSCGFSNSTYLSERDTAYRNHCLGYMMLETGAFPDDCKMEDVLETYFQVCSMLVTAEKMSVMAATLANGGVNPFTGDRIFSANTVRNCLSLMLSCGMYDYSGQWAFRMGVPAKSGVGGCVFTVVPGVAGFATFSPRLDEIGNSTRGVGFARELMSVFNFHQFDILDGESNKRSPTVMKEQAHENNTADMLWAAAEGDIERMRYLVASGVDPSSADYDKRSALHLACSEGKLEAVQFLLNVGADQNAQDRWGNTPMDDAVRENHDDVASLLKQTASLISE